MKIKAIVRKSIASVVLSLCTIVFAAPASADTVTKVDSKGLLFGALQPTYFQLSSVPGVWIYADTNRAAAGVVDMAWAMGGGINVQHASAGAGSGYDIVKRIDASDASAQGNNYRVQSFILWDNSDKYDLGNTLNVNFTSTLSPSLGTSCYATTPEHVGLVMRAFFSHTPLQTRITKTSYYDPYTNKFVYNVRVCELGINSGMY